MSASVEAHDMEVNLWVQVDCVVEVELEAVVELELELNVMEILVEGDGGGDGGCLEVLA